jgi:hypothetical protein
VLSFSAWTAGSKVNFRGKDACDNKDFSNIFVELAVLESARQKVSTRALFLSPVTFRLA